MIGSLTSAAQHFIRSITDLILPSSPEVTTPEQLTELPAMTLVRIENQPNAVFQHLGNGWWWEPGSIDAIHSETVIGVAEGVGSVIVLWTPPQATPEPTEETAT